MRTQGHRVADVECGVGADIVVGGVARHLALQGGNFMCLSSLADTCEPPIGRILAGCRPTVGLEHASALGGTHLTIQLAPPKEKSSV
jgi:hypothetical protein